jgi:hypothetical protein
MTDEPSREERLTDRLLAEDRRGRDAAARGAVPASDALLERLLDSEQAFERRVRRVAIGAWSAVLTLVPLIGVSMVMRRLVFNGFLQNAVRTGAVVMGVLVILGFSLAILATVAWLFRPRTASLVAIERRLLALEELLTRSR